MLYGEKRSALRNTQPGSSKLKSALEFGLLYAITLIIAMTVGRAQVIKIMADER